MSDFEELKDEVSCAKALTAILVRGGTQEISIDSYLNVLENHRPYVKIDKAKTVVLLARPYVLRCKECGKVR